MRDTFIAKIANEIPDSGIKDFFDVANKMKDAISLGVGEPDFLVPAYVREKAIDSSARSSCPLFVRKIFVALSSIKGNFNYSWCQ